MGKREYLQLEDCNTPSDLDRLDPYEYAELLSRPATMLDCHRLRLLFQSQLAELAGIFKQRIEEQNEVNQRLASAIDSGIARATHAATHEGWDGT